MPLSKAIPAVKPSIRLIFIGPYLRYIYLPPLDGFVRSLFWSLFLRAIRVRL
jgi:hypothetical protein